MDTITSYIKSIKDLQNEINSIILKILYYSFGLVILLLIYILPFNFFVPGLENKNFFMMTIPNYLQNEIRAYIIVTITLLCLIITGILSYIAKSIIRLPYNYYDIINKTPENTSLNQKDTGAKN